MIRCTSVVKIEPLVEGNRLQQIPAACANVARFEKCVLGDLILETKIPLLHVRCLQIAIHRAKFERLSDVAGWRCSGAARVSRDAGVVADHICTSRSRSARDPKRQPAAKRKCCRLSAECVLDW